MTERFSVYVAVYLLLVRDGKVLLLRRYNTGWQDGKYSMVAGHLDGKETVTEALIREAREEACIELRKENLRVVHTMHRKSKDREYIDFFLTADTWTGDIRIGEPDKCDALEWFPLNEIPENTLPYIREAIVHYTNGVTFSESGWNGDAV